MNYRLLVLCSTLIYLVSCSNEKGNIVIAGNDLTSVTHIYYNYGIPDQPATSTYTSNYILNDNKINSIDTSVFVYNHEEPELNYSIYLEAIFSYDTKNRLSKVVRERYDENDITDISFNTFEFDYYDNDKIKSLVEKDGNGVILDKRYFNYQDNTIEIKEEFYEDGIAISYRITILHTDTNQRIYRQIYKGSFSVSTDENSNTDIIQEASFDKNGNVHQTYFEGRLTDEYEYSDIKIPSDLPNIPLPIQGYIPYNNLLQYFDKIVESYNTNYITAINPLPPSYRSSSIYKNTLSLDSYPLKIELFYDGEIISETIYKYE